MATTFVDYTGDGNATKAFSFPSIKEADIKVDVDGVIKTSGNHYNITSYTTTGGGNVVFTSGNIPASPAAIRIFRDTDVDSAKATFTAGSSVKAGDLNNNMTQILYAAQEEQNQTILTSDIKDAAVTTAKIKADNITSALIADDQINSEHYVDGSIDTAHIADSQITSAKIADGTIVAGDLASNAITTVKITDSNVTTAKIADSNVTTAKIADSNVTTAKIADSNVTTAKIANANVTTAKIADSNVTTDKIADNNVTADKLAHTSVSAGSYTAADITVDAQGRLTSAASGTIATSEIADSAVTTAKIADDAITTGKIAALQVTHSKLSANSVDSVNYVDGSIDTVHIGNDQVTAGKLGTDSVTTLKITDANVTTPKIADLAVTTAKIANDNVTTGKIGGAQVTDAKLASNAVTTTKITDANVTTAKIADSNVTLAKLASDLKQTTISDSDTQLPTSGAVVDYVAAQIAPLGGLEVIATEVAFPNSQPSSGVVISISDAQGVVVNGSGTSTTGRTVGGSTVTINNFPSSLNNETLAAGVGLMVSSTGSSQTYNYHKLLAAETDVKQLSDDINDFQSRYRVGASNPTSSLDNGDLFFNTGTGKLLVYNGTNSAWEETQTIGNFFINTLSSSTGTGGGSATFNGSAYRFTLSNAGTFVQQHLVSVNGVIQKPNTGTSQPSEGFALDGADIIFSAAPASGADFFIITIGSSVSIGTPSDGTVSTAKLANGAVTTAKLADANVTAAKIATAAVTTAKIDGDAVTEAKIANNACTVNKVATNAVTTNKIADDAVTTAKIADDAVTNAQLATGCVSTNQIANGAILNADINASAAIAGTKINPNFGSQNINAVNITASNDVTAKDMVISDSTPTLVFADSDHNPDYKINVDGGNFNIQDSTNSADRLRVNSDGHVDIYGNLDVGSGVDVTGNITVSGTVDGRDVATDGTKLDGIAANAIDGSALNASNLSSGTIPDARFPSTLPAVSGANLTGITSVGGSTGVDFNDNVTVRFGTSNDTVVKHDLYSRLNISFDTSNTSVAEQVPPGGIRIANDNMTTGRLSGLYFTHGSGTANVGIFAKSLDNATASSGQGSDMIFYTKRNGQSNMAERAKFTNYGHFVPTANATYDLGDSSLRWRNVYTNDLHLSNEGHTNEVDGTWGNWTIQEGESDLFLKNNRSGKTYKFNLTEVS